MVATWNPAAAAGYYTRQTGYYTASGEPLGTWYAPDRAFGLIDGQVVVNDVFDRLFAGRGEAGGSLLSNSGGRLDRTPAFDITLSAPRSVSLLWALGDSEMASKIEAAQHAAVRQTLDLLQREAIRARRGRGGGRIERVPLTAALFQHGESRPAEHEDGLVFGDPNLHTHCVVLNLARRRDGSIGALHSKILRDWKMAAGATYHAALAAELQAAGFAIDRIGRNGVFEVAGIGDPAIRYFSARRREIETELAHDDGSGVIDPVQAAAVARSTRSPKSNEKGERRQDTWRRAAHRIGLEVASQSLQFPSRERSGQREGYEARLAALPVTVTETASVIDRRELVRSVAEALVGSGMDADHIARSVEEQIREARFEEVGHDALGQPRYSTPDMIRIERELVDTAAILVRRGHRDVKSEAVVSRCRGLSTEQTQAALRATSDSCLAIIEGAPGTGKTTLLKPIVEAWRAAGVRVIGSATAWRVANALRDDLAIEARSSASWIAGAEAGRPFLDSRTVLIVDEAGLLSSREMHRLLKAADRSDAKILLVGDRGQLQPIGAGSGLALAARAAETARVEAIVRQNAAWAREAVLAFGRGDAGVALSAYADHGQLVEASTPSAAMKAAVDRVEEDLIRKEPGDAVILAKTNVEVAAIGREVRSRLRESGILTGLDISVDAATPSGHRNDLALASGDRIRFLARCDAIGVVNGTVATVHRVSSSGSDARGLRHARIEAHIGSRRVTFDTRELADPQGRARLGWAHASTIYGSQGMTVGRASVLLTPAFDRHDLYVAASRAREATTLIIDQQAIERQMQGDAGSGHSGSRTQPGRQERLAWLATKVSRANAKETTVDIIDPVRVDNGRCGPQNDSVQRDPTPANISKGFVSESIREFGYNR
ncbi:MobF family relaxase [Azorhizobium caulinodans]|uniref:MobF family relaxase n=1 Tax=Azorhizobium caulinodans TaxID=7 RepID=UPI002FBDF44C